jgi:GNAT superfamily N-acetyltransferase
MSSSPPVELVVASFDDPIVGRLRIEPGTRRTGSSDQTTTGRFEVADGPGDAGMVFLVARSASDPVGCAGLRRLGDDTAEVERLYVRPEYRRLGISRLLLAGVEDLARRRGFTVARLEAGDLRAAGLYASSGYVRIAPFGRHPARSVCFEKSLLVQVAGGRMTGPRPGPRTGARTTT